MYRSVVPAIVPDVAPTTLISVGGVTIFDVTAAPACPAGHAPDTHAAAEVAPAAEVVPAGQDVHVAGHPVTCTSAKLKTRPVPYIEIWRY